MTFDSENDEGDVNITGSFNYERFYIKTLVVLKDR